MQKGTVKSSECHRRKKLGMGGNPLLIGKIYTPPPQERKAHPPLGFLTLSTCALDWLGQIVKWAIDGTFTSVPHLWFQLVTLLVVLSQNCSIPALYCAAE